MYIGREECCMYIGREECCMYIGRRSVVCILDGGVLYVYRTDECCVCMMYIGRTSVVCIGRTSVYIYIGRS